ncbi:MAG: hypothetical protein A3I66_12080 [Burkholderiales bacterium RIFCSPLOWO2_02_FULL_57_36]|nr:MAG: hypothetical protein A3I66_12080 [Burkholderiales bacterium RIFCSPLOWO2_02_FULL_57_36]
MREFEPSRTAMTVAMLRAAHQIMDTPRVFEDDLAVSILGEHAQPMLRSLIGAADDEIESISLRAFLAARSRHAEDCIARAVQGGIEQCIILGAGLDTFAYRCTDARLRIFEVDHPATQAWKRTRLLGENIPVPASLAFVPVDFAQTSLEQELIKAGWDAARPSVISWLGVVQYLTRDTTMKMLAFVASMPPGSEIVFDYAISPDLMNAAQKKYFETLQPRLAASGEPLQTCFDPAALVAALEALGFGAVEDVAPDRLNALYFRGRADGLRTMTTISHIIRARV